MRRLAWVDTGRGIAIVLVALFHATNWMSAHDVGFDLDTALDVNVVLSSIRMPLFFAISGLFAAKWLEGAWLPLLRHKVLLFVWVYGVWSVIGAALLYYGSGLNGDRGSIPAAIRHLLMTPVEPRFELWFIWSLALFFVLAKATRRIDVRVQMGVAIVVSIIALSGLDIANVGWSGSLKYYAFFLAGIYLRDQIFAFSRVDRPVLLAGVVAVWAASGTALVVFDAQSVPGLYFLNCALGLLAGVCLGRALSRLRILPYLGSRTLPIYLGHTPLIIVIALLMSTLDIPGFLPGPLDYAVAPLVAAVAIALALVLNRFAMRTGQVWLYEPPHWLVRALRLDRQRESRGFEPVVTDADRAP